MMGPCILNFMANYSKQRINSVKLLVPRINYTILKQDESKI